MRLTHAEQTRIKTTLQEVFEPQVKVWLFGSRVDDTKAGGDVDLYIETSQVESLFDARIKAIQQLEQYLPYPVDVVVREPNVDLPIYRLAKTQGVLL